MEPSEQLALGLNEHHQDQIVQYMRFMRYMRGLRLRSIDASFEDVLKVQLQADTTFTRDEVIETLNSLKSVVHTDTETELLNAAHTNVLLLRQMCAQAEKWHLKLLADVSELENRELLDAIQSFEEHQFNVKQGEKLNITVLKRLEPIAGGGAAPLLQAEIDRLKEENVELKSKCRLVETQAKGIIEEKQQQLLELRSNVQMVPSAASQSSTSEAEINDLRDQLAKLKMRFENDLTATQMNEAQLESALTSTKHRLLDIQSQLEMAEKELEKKFSQTGAYKNMRQMLNKKNEQIKELRKRLGKYESNADTDED